MTPTTDPMMRSRLLVLMFTDLVLSARCDWMANRYEPAIMHFKKAIHSNHDTSKDSYLKQCLAAVTREAEDAREVEGN